MILARRCARIIAAALLATGPAWADQVRRPGASMRVETGGYIDGLAVAPLGGPRQRPQAVTEVFFGTITRSWRTRVSLRGGVGGPFEGAEPGVMNLVHTFQNRSPSVEVNEAWVELLLPDADLRVGIQKFAWGKLDGPPPTDVLTPRDLHDPLVRDGEESKIGIPALQGRYFAPPISFLHMTDLRATLVYVPFASPPRLALVKERWFPPSITTSGLGVPERRAERLINDVIQEIIPGAPPIDLDGPLRVPIELRTANNAPPKSVSAGGIALRLEGTIHEMDWSVSHYTGPETAPDAALLSIASCRSCLTALSQGRLPIRVQTFLKQKHDVLHMTGADWSAVFGGATVRGEVAVFQNRPSLRDTEDLIAEALTPAVVSRYGPRLVLNGRSRIPLGELFPDRDIVEWGIGVDYLINGFFPLLQLNQVIFVDSGPPELTRDPETQLLLSIRRSFFKEKAELELRGLYAIEPGAWIVFPQASYRLGDHWRLRLSYLGIGGPTESFIGQFNANDEFVFEARYSF